MNFLFRSSNGVRSYSRMRMINFCQIFQKLQRNLIPFLFVWLVWGGGQLFAHSMSVSFIEITLKGSQANFKYRLPMAELDLLFLVDENLDGTYQQSEVEKASSQIDHYMQEQIKLKVNNFPITLFPQNRELWSDEEDHMFVDLWQEVVLSEKISQVDFVVKIFQELIPDHKTLVLINSEEGSRQLVFDQSNPGTSWTPEDTGFWAQFFNFLVLGAEHIFLGYDHVLFLIGILLLGQTLLQIVKIVTSFTVAHSFTLVLATLGILTPNEQLVETGIALSIAYIGLENLIDKHWTQAWHTTFVFGLVHGFGFASVLKEMELSSVQLASSLFSFNLGVEIGQIFIVSMVFPLLLFIRRYHWRMWVIRGIAMFIFVFGIVWLFERILES